MEPIQLEDISREQAEEWLEATTHNRKISDRYVEFMRRDMDGGRWEVDIAPPILIDKKGGGVIDGQHRLWAFLMSKKRVLKAYVKYVPRKHIQVVDTGRSRSLKDTLTIRGHDHAVAKSAWLNRAVQWATGYKAYALLNRSQQVEFVETAPNVEKAVELATSVRTSRKHMVHLPIGTVASLLDMQVYGFGMDAVMEFVHTVQTSQGIDPLLTRLQKKLLDAINPRSKLTLSPDSRSYLIARVFHSWANGEDLTRIYARRKAVLELPGYAEWYEANPFHLMGLNEVEAEVVE